MDNKDNHKDTLPLKVDPFRFAENAISLDGLLPIKALQRLCTSLVSHEGSIQVNLGFGVDEQGIRYIKAHLAGILMLQCQRCLEPFEYAVTGNFLSGVVHTEKEAGQLPGRYDPLVVADNELILSDLIEEELIVSLPIVPMHQGDNMKECKATLPFVLNAKGGTEMEKDNPFKVIESLRSKRDK